MRAESVEFDAAGVTLSGSVYLPADEVGAAGMVLVGGSGPADRSNAPLDSIAEHLVAWGIAVLAYDKRGVGGSSGEWAGATVDDLAADAAAAVQTLRHVTGVRSVGVLGHSEGAWVALRLAVDGADISSLILQSGPAVPFIDSEVFALIRAGAPASTSEAIDRFLRALTTTDPSPAGYQRAMQLVAAAKTEAWFAAVEAQGFTFNEDAWKQIRAWGSYDPRGDLDRLQTPTFVLLGEDDPLVPLDASVRAYEESAARTGRSQRVVVIPGAGHRFRTDNNRFVPGYLPALFESLPRSSFSQRSSR